jgi:hypothetical protein
VRHPQIPAIHFHHTDGEAEFDFRVVGDGRSAVARYANNSNYRNDSLIRKESTSPHPRQTSSTRLTSVTVCVSALMIQEIKRIIKQSEIMKYVFAPFPSQEYPLGSQKRWRNLQLTSNQGRRHEVAAEEQGRPARTGDQIGKRAHLIRGLKNSRPVE